jgi:hypothetical protein
VEQMANYQNILLNNNAQIMNTICDLLEALRPNTKDQDMINKYNEAIDNFKNAFNQMSIVIDTAKSQNPSKSLGDIFASDDAQIFINSILVIKTVTTLLIGSIALIAGVLKNLEKIICVVKEMIRVKVYNFLENLKGKFADLIENITKKV